MKVKEKKASKYEEMSVDSFFDNLDKLSSENGTVNDKPAKKSKKDKDPVKSKKKKKNKAVAEEKSIKDSLKNLKNTDPELFNFLEQNDKKLLNFRDEAEEEEPNNEGEMIHEPPENLDVASDESDFEPEENEQTTEKKSKKNVITLKMLKSWEKELQSETVSAETIRSVIKAFNSALISIAGDPSVQGEYKVEGSAIFNGIVQLCVLNLEKAIKVYLKIPKKSNLKEIQKCKRFNKMKNALRCYLMDLAKLLENVTSSNILSIILKHFHQIGGALVAFSSITKVILKRLIQIWSSGEESIRILAFLCILKITRNSQELFLNHVLRTMYMEYVKNSKFVSPNTLPSINFMRRSLTELFLLDLNAAYHHVFLFIRQLAIHLRNALLLQKKEHFQQVYNWQYINSLKLWGDFLSAVVTNVSATNSQAAKADSKSKLQALIYPLVSIINGVIKLKSSAHYFPLRFHCIQILIDLSRSTKVFIPILPYILEVLNSNTFNQQHKKLAMKPLSFTCILRIQKGHLEENSFRDEVIEQVHDLTLDCLINECTSIAFPDLIVPHIMALNHFIKKTKNSNYSKKLKQLVDKIMEQSELVNSKRNQISFALSDENYVRSWEINLRTGDTPLEIYHKRVHSEKLQKVKRQKMDKIDDEETVDYGKLPKIEKKVAGKKNDGPVELFPSDDESGDDNINFDADSDMSFENDESEEEVVPVSKKNAKKVQQRKEASESSENESSEEDSEMFVDNQDIVKDMSIDDW